MLNLQGGAARSMRQCTERASRRYVANPRHNLRFESCVFRCLRLALSLVGLSLEQRPAFLSPGVMQHYPISAIRCVREAVSEVIHTWSVRLAGTPLIELRALKIDQDGRDTTELFQLHEMSTSLARSHRIVIEAPAGRGKTTTLVQLAKHHGSLGGLAFLIDLPVRIQSGTDVLQFIGGMPPFLSRG